MDLFIEIIFRGLIVRVIGMHSRYLFFKLIGNNKSLDDLKGGKGKIESQQDFYNAVTGLILFSSISVGIAYIVFS